MADFSGSPAPVFSTEEQRPVARASSANMLRADLPVRADSSAIRTLMTVTIAVDPGDLLAVDGRCVVTNDLGYTVGMGAHIWAWDASLPYTETWERIGPYASDNVTASRHHMPLAATAEWVMPSTWLPGGLVTIALQASAFSDSPSRMNAHALVVEDGYGHLRVERWAPDTVTTDALDRLATVEAQLATLTAAVASLTPPPNCTPEAS